MSDTEKVINHDLRVVDGRTILMPAWKGGQEGYGNLALPDIRDVDAVQKYPIGAKLLDGERVFYYAKASLVGVSKTDYGVKNGYRQHVRHGAITAVAVAGDKEITLDVNSSDGIGGNGNIGKDELAGGFVVVFNHDDDAFTSRILENTKVTGGGDMTLQLQDEIPVPLAIAAVDHAECMAHWLLGCEWNQDSEEPVVGVAHAKVDGGYWFWIQTWGPVWLGPTGIGPGNAADRHNVLFQHTGEVLGQDADTLEVVGLELQQAGFTLAHAIAGGQGAPFFMLQICP